ncbi:MAG: hypothetical protein FWH52_01390, partial [Synergistaceae bacterium]|nr:hypothetical protein [Synergistaceae bacterium]
QSHKPKGASIIISSHLVTDVEGMLDYVYFLSNGKVVYHGVCSDIQGQQTNHTLEQKYLEVFLNEGDY